MRSQCDGRRGNGGVNVELEDWEGRLARVPATISSHTFEARINSIQRFADDRKSAIQARNADLCLNTDLPKLRSVMVTKCRGQLIDFLIGTAAVFKTF
jgi:hypothetical protein